MSEPIRCRYCGVTIVVDPAIRTPSSAWSAPETDDPTACRPEAPGHAPRTNVAAALNKVDVLDD
jgi:hypothetical protein